MINILFNLIAINYLQFDKNGQHKFSFSNKGEGIYLKRGKYIFDLYGGQGGFGYIDGQKSGTGGLGAHIHAECYIVSINPILYNVFVGGAGVGNDRNPGSPYSRSDGGFNGGGKGGIKSPNSAAGGGGGATDIRLNYNDITTRQLVASGGSGGTFFPGNPGGALCGLSRDNSPDEYFCSSITNTFGDWEEYCKHPGIGQDGPDRNDTPCSGGGGGYCGGDAEIYYDQNWPMTADSGTSYAKNCSSKLDDELCFFNVFIDIGVNQGDGLVIITQLWECADENCLFCKDAGDICERCKNGYLKYNGTCVSSCPEATYKVGEKCYDCKKPCHNCITNSNNCISCIENYSLYNNKCYSECPNGTFSKNNECFLCSENCKTCSNSADSCNSCKDNYFYFENKCYLQCSDLSNEIKGEYYGKNNNEKVCQKCSDENCILCEDDFNKCQKCSSLYYLDYNTFECIHIKTSEFTFSNKFSSSIDFSESNLFSNSDIFSVSNVFTESEKFSKSLSFTSSSKFSYSDIFSESNDFSKSNYFTFSSRFSKSLLFTSSTKFSFSNLFSKSSDFSKSVIFSVSNAFTESENFSNSLLFTNSIKFSYSDLFSKSMDFSKSNLFSLTNIFTLSLEFTCSNTFLPTSIRKKKPKKGIIIGVSIGCIVLLLILLFLLILLNKYKKENRKLGSDIENGISISNDNKSAKNLNDNDISLTELTDDIDLNFWI